jgi:serine/threonine-protein phosphatase 2A regulatory subunit B
MPALQHFHRSQSKTSSIVLSSISPGEACLLTRIARCFGDKGDVEDITEGTACISCYSIYLDFQSPAMDMLDDWWGPESLERDTNYFSAADIISTVEFDHTGNYLATGDKGGRVVLFERNETVGVT